MERGKAQFARLMELDRLIREETFPNCLSFARRWEVSPKTVQRDVDFLRDQLGAPVVFDRARNGFRYTDVNWFLPSLNVSEGDLLALLLATRALEPYRGSPVAHELEAVFRKIAALLPDGISVRPELLFGRFSFTTPPSRPVTEAVWTPVVPAQVNLRPVRVRYRRPGAESDDPWVLHPYHLANLQGEWYVFGVREDDPRVKQYALARIRRAEVTDGSFAIPPTFDPDRLLSATFGRFSMGDAVHRVRLRFDREAAPWVLERAWSPRQKTVRRPDGSVELSFPAAGLFEVQRWILAWGRHVRVLAPAELRRSFCEEVRAMELLCRASAAPRRRAVLRARPLTAPADRP